MKLYYVPGTCALAPHIALQESGLKYEAIKVDPKTKQTASGVDYNTINPKSSVPALDIGEGKILTECAVLLQFIAEQKQEKVSLPKYGTYDRYKANEWLNYIATELHKSFTPFYAPIPDAAKDILKERLFKRFDFMEKHLEKNMYILGKEYSPCDIYFFTVMRWTKNMKIDLSKWPHLMGLMERVQNRPAVAATLKAEGLT